MSRACWPSLRWRYPRRMSGAFMNELLEADGAGRPRRPAPHGAEDKPDTARVNGRIALRRRRLARLIRRLEQWSGNMAIARPGKIVGVGRNSREHAAELGHVGPKHPLIFLKPSTAVIGDGDTIVLPPEAARVEHEAEIGVVIGTRIRRVGEAQALAAVAGVTCVNDVTARDLQRGDEQWTRAKGFDTFGPVGPRLAPLAVVRLGELEVRCRVNGVERQRGHARDMVFAIASLIAFVSQVMTLEPGDLIAKGTPAGVGSRTAGDGVGDVISGEGRW